jgi:hypothetical protein
MANMQVGLSATEFREHASDLVIGFIRGRFK